MNTGSGSTGGAADDAAVLPAAGMRPIDPELVEVWNTTTGAGFIQAMADGRIPRSTHMEDVGVRVRTAEPGLIELVWEPTERICNRAGIVHGGYLSIVLDDAAGIAAASLGERFVPCLTMNLNIDFLRPAYPGRVYTAIGTIVKPGSARIVADGRIEDADGKLIARASGSFIPNKAYRAAPPGFTHTS